MADAAAAAEMFRVADGDKVEHRRESIEKHALEVRIWTCDRNVFRVALRSECRRFGVSNWVYRVRLGIAG